MATSTQDRALEFAHKCEMAGRIVHRIVVDGKHTPVKKCPVCHGRGYRRCGCWPGDCICGWDDEDCEACCGTGDADWDDDLDLPAPTGGGE